METYLEYLPLVLSGTLVTVAVSFFSLIISTILGLLGALAKLSKKSWLRKLGMSYTTIVRGIPDLVLILLIFYGSQMLLNHITESMGVEYIVVSPFAAGVFTMGFIYGAYMSETFRGAILAVEYGQIEAAEAFGMKSYQVFFRVTFPQMVQHAFAGYVNNWQVILKAAALISIVGLEDLVRKSSIAGNITKKPFAYLITAAVIYIAITSLSMLFLKLVENKYRVVR